MKLRLPSTKRDQDNLYPLVSCQLNSPKIISNSPVSYKLIKAVRKHNNIIGNIYLGSTQSTFVAYRDILVNQGPIEVIERLTESDYCFIHDC